MTNVLIAIDETKESRRAAEVAATCFGPDANYFAIYVDEQQPVGGPLWGSGVGWGRVYAAPLVGAPLVAAPLIHESRAADDGVPSGDREVASDESLGVGMIDDARVHAGRLAADAGVMAKPLGGVGDPATAIVTAAEEYGVDVIVVGSHQRGWFGKLFHGSTTDDVLEDAGVPVLVVR